MRTTRCARAAVLEAVRVRPSRDQLPTRQRDQKERALALIQKLRAAAKVAVSVLVIVMECVRELARVLKRASAAKALEALVWPVSVLAALEFGLMVWQPQQHRKRQSAACRRPHRPAPCLLLIVMVFAEFVRTERVRKIEKAPFQTKAAAAVAVSQPWPRAVVFVVAAVRRLSSLLLLLSPSSF